MVSGHLETFCPGTIIAKILAIRTLSFGSRRGRVDRSRRCRSEDRIFRSILPPVGVRIIDLGKRGEEFFDFWRGAREGIHSQYNVPPVASDDIADLHDEIGVFHSSSEFRYQLVI